jgi:hypothetical protein
MLIELDHKLARHCNQACLWLQLGTDKVLSRFLHLCDGTWFSYENAVTIPGDLLLELLVSSYVEPRWLLSGEGPKFWSTVGGAVCRPDVEGTDRWRARRAELE